MLTVPTIGGDSIEEYATRVFESWKLGQKGKDNGVLVVVAPKDRKMRIEVGYGLEGTLTDAPASRIIRNVMTPRSRTTTSTAASSAGVDAIVAQLEGARGRRRDVPTSSSSAGRSELSDGHRRPDLPPWPMRILLGASSSASSGCSRSSA